MTNLANQSLRQRIFAIKRKINTDLEKVETNQIDGNTYANKHLPEQVNLITELQNDINAHIVFLNIRSQL